MIYDLIMSLRSGADARDVVPGILFTIIVVLFSLSLHETSHGWMANKLGDRTARNLGRLTLNPAKHLDFLGTVSMLLFGFGWAKPVPVNSRYFKKPRRDMALTALAGPVSNILLSFISVFIVMVLLATSSSAQIFLFSNFSGNAIMEASIGGKIVALLCELFWYAHILNLYLAVFNLIPIPPLDGSRILFIFLPDKVYFGLMKYERYIMIIMLALLWTGMLSNPLSWLCGVISSGMQSVIGLIPGL